MSSRHMVQLRIACTYFLVVPIESNHSYLCAFIDGRWDVRVSVCVCVCACAETSSESKWIWKFSLFATSFPCVALCVCDSIPSQLLLFFSHSNGRLIWYWMMRMRKSQWRKMGNESAAISMSWMNFSIVKMVLSIFGNKKHINCIYYLGWRCVHSFDTRYDITTSQFHVHLSIHPSTHTRHKYRLTASQWAKNANEFEVPLPHQSNRCGMNAHSAHIRARRAE